MNVSIDENEIIFILVRIIFILYIVFSIKKTLIS